MSSVAILLCTFNGARFLPDQVSSLADQTWRNWSAFASDDGSTGETVATLSQYQEALGGHPVWAMVLKIIGLFRLLAIYPPIYP
ncbi:MAG: glycosyltransferase, partial [Xanthobacteraceae bacterium]